MLQSFRSKVLFTLFVFIIIGFSVLYQIVSTGYEDMVVKEGKRNAQMLGDSIFQTVRMSMNIGVREMIDAGLDNARKIAGVRSLEIHKSQSVIDLFNMPDKVSQKKDIQHIFESKQSQIAEVYENGEHNVLLQKPLIADEGCMVCHQDGTLKEGDVLGVLELRISTESFYEQIEQSENYLLLTMFVAGILALLGLYIFFEKELVKPLNRLRDMAKDLTEDGGGDLTKRIAIKSNDEVGITSNYVNRFIKIIQETIAVSKHVSEENTQTCKGLLEMSNVLSKNSDAQFELVDRVNLLAQDVSKKLDVAEKTTSSTISDIAQTESILDDFVKNLQDTIGLITNSAQTQQNILQHVEELTQHADQIKSVLSIIADIADQTNLLALADEVRKLAEKTQKSLNEIAASVNLVTQSVQDVGQTIRDTTKDMMYITEKTSPLIDDAHHTQQNLVLTKQNSIHLKDISTSIAQSTKELAQMMQDIVRSSESTQSVGHTIQKDVNDMSQKAQELDNAITKFKT